MGNNGQAKPSFSLLRKWSIGLNVCLLILVVLSVVVMVNYLGRDYFLRVHCSARTRDSLSPLTLKFLQSLTNRIKIIIYYDRDESLYSTVAALLKEYKDASPRIAVQTVDYLRDVGAAQKVKADYKLSSATDKDVIIFDCEGKKFIIVDGAGLAHYVMEQVPDEKERLYRRRATEFLGETMFTGALLAVTNPKPLEAYLLQGHGEHPFASSDPNSAVANFGYLKFATVLKQYYIDPQPLSLVGSNTVPADCHLLVVAGPTQALPDVELEKIEQYLDQGGHLLVLFNFLSLDRDTRREKTGLDKVLAKWGVQVDANVIQDPENYVRDLNNLVVQDFNRQHPIVNPLVESRLCLYRPRSVGKLTSRPQAADAPRVDELAFTGSKAYAADPRQPHRFPLIAAVQKGDIKGVLTERGSTRIVVVGDSIFLANGPIDSVANRDFAGQAVNWLLNRTQLLRGLGPRPVVEYKLVMTRAQMQNARWILLAAMPGGVLLLGGLVWLRRRS